MRQCTYEGCGRDLYIKGLCKTHYMMQWRGEELRPIRPVKRYAAPGPGLKICTSCERVKKVETSFYKRSSSGEPLSSCKECMKKYQIEYNRRRKEAGTDED